MRPRTASGNPLHAFDVWSQVHVYLLDLTREWPGITHVNVWSLTWLQWCMYRGAIDQLREKARATDG